MVDEPLENNDSSEPKEEINNVQNKPEKVPEIPNIKNKQLNEFISTKDWLTKIGWKKNPFTFEITPSLFVGYEEQKRHLMHVLEQKHKIVLVTGPTGSGKTTLMMWAQDNVPKNYFSIYIEKPPDVPEGLVDVLTAHFRPAGFLQNLIYLIKPKIKNLYEIPDFLNSKTIGKHVVIFFDEIHETDVKVLEWLRVLSDHLDNATIVLGGLHVFEQNLEKLETLRKRIAAKIDLLSLTKEETIELIQRRIAASGGRGDEFDNVIDIVYEKTGGFPREILRMCNEFVNMAVRKNDVLIQPNLLTFDVKKEAHNVHLLDRLTPMQRDVVEHLQKPLTPGQVANMLDLQKYKSRQHAVRSVNNILKVLMQQGFVERVKEDKAYLYHLSPRIKTLVVKN